ncbi:MAG: thioesterase family protein [Chloroflexota bacterium]|nr:thioesterase family protein [Chloroflexota bacterium]
MSDSGLRPGLVGEKQTLVCEHNVAGHVDKFSTPSMIGLMERAAIEAIQLCLEDGQTSVGYEVNVRHLAPSEIGETVTATAELLDVDRNRLTFNVEAYSGETMIGSGTHKRAIINKSG